MVKIISRVFSFEIIFSILVATAMLMRLNLTFVHEINWDEFLHLSIVYNHASGELQNALQTVFVHSFHWVKFIPGNEVDQVIAARLFIYTLNAATVGFIYLICRRFMAVHAALFALLCYLSFSFVLRNGNSFRTDPIATCLLMATLWLIVCRPPRLRYALIAGGLTGLAGMITIKAIFYVPTIAIILLIQSFAAENRKNAVLYGLTTASSALLAFLAVYFLHSLTIVDQASTVDFLGRATGKTLGERDFGNAIRIFRSATALNPIFWLAAGMGIIACVRGLIRSRGHDRSRWAIQLAFAVVLGSLLVYTQTFPYYYPFMLAPVAVLCGAGLTIIPSPFRSGVTAIAGLALAVALLAYFLISLRDDTAAQRLTLDVVHKAFPEATSYIDSYSMVSSYPKRSFFMSLWGKSKYYRANVPVMRSVIEQHQPRFLIANRRMLELDDLGPDEYGPDHLGLFKEDVETLKANYIKHWGAIYVAGKKFTLSRAAPSQDFTILIEGTYTIVSRVPILLNGRRMQPNDVVTLSNGPHQIEMLATEANVTLHWGEHLYRPSEEAPVGPLFHGF